MWRVIFILLFLGILVASFAHVVEEGPSFRFYIAAIVSAMAVAYLFATRRDEP
jgi:hypothetical protein